MISLQKKFLFIHIPKTGGNSLQSILKRYSEDKIVIRKSLHQDGVERFQVCNDIFQTVKHSSLVNYQEKLDPDIFHSLYKFSIVRNPWDRMISFFFSPHRGARQWDRAKFIEMVKHTPPLRFYLGLSEDRLKPLDAEVDSLIRFESLEKDFQRVCCELGIEYEPLPIMNVALRDHYSNYYDDELITFVESVFREEIEYFNYQFS